MYGNFMNAFAPPPTMPQGRWLTARSFQDIQSAPIPADGTQVLFLMENAPVLYVATMVNGVKNIAGFQLSPLTNDTQQQPQPPTMEQQMAALSAQVAKLTAMMEGKANEPNPANGAADAATA